MTALAKRLVIKFYCNTCDQKLSVPAGLEGQKFSCPNCTAPGHVPGSPPTELGVNGEAVIKFFCLHCGQKLSCEAGAEGKAAQCPVCGEATPVPVVPPAPDPPASREKPVPPSVNGVRKEEPEVVLGPDSERHKGIRSPEGATPAPAGGATAIPGMQSPRPREASSTGPAESSSGTEPSAHPGLNGTGRVPQGARFVMGSVSPEELFESLEDLGFEVAQVPISPAEDRKPDPERIDL